MAKTVAKNGVVSKRAGRQRHRARLQEHVGRQHEPGWAGDSGLRAPLATVDHLSLRADATRFGNTIRPLSVPSAVGGRIADADVRNIKYC